MSLTKKRTMTESSLQAHRANGAQGHGPATVAGKARSAAANLRHGFYSDTRDEALIALGEDPAKYRKMLRALAEDLQPRPGLEAEVVLLMGRVLWRLYRAQRMQDGVVLKRLRGETRREELYTGTLLTAACKAEDRIMAIPRALNRPGYFPNEPDIQAWLTSLGKNIPDAVIESVPMLRDLGKMGRNMAERTQAGQSAADQAAERLQAEQLREKVQAVIFPALLPFGESTVRIMKECDGVRAPENLAAMMAPKEENAVLMQRVEDSLVRQLWRLIIMFMRLRNGELR